MLHVTSALRSSWTFLWLGALTSAASAAPLDVLDPTPRPIWVQFETSANPGVVGVAYSAAFPGFYSASGNVGTVSVSGPVYEAYLTSVGGINHLPVVPGTFSSFVLSIDRTTLHATAASPQGQLVAPAGPNAFVSRGFSSSAPAGFVLWFGHLLFLPRQRPARDLQSGDGLCVRSTDRQAECSRRRHTRASGHPAGHSQRLRPGRRPAAQRDPAGSGGLPGGARSGAATRCARRARARPADRRRARGARTRRDAPRRARARESRSRPRGRRPARRAATPCRRAPPRAARSARRPPRTRPRPSRNPRPSARPARVAPSQSAASQRSPSQPSQAPRPRSGLAGRAAAPRGRARPACPRRATRQPAGSAARSAREVDRLERLEALVGVQHLLRRGGRRREQRAALAQREAVAVGVGKRDGEAQQRGRLGESAVRALPISPPPSRRAARRRREDRSRATAKP